MIFDLSTLSCRVEKPGSPRLTPSFPAKNPTKEPLILTKKEGDLIQILTQLTIVSGIPMTCKILRMNSRFKGSKAFLKSALVMHLEEVPVL